MTVRGTRFCRAAKISGFLIHKSILSMLAIFLTATTSATQTIPHQPDLRALFTVVGRLHNIDANLLEAMAQVESGDNPLSVSPRGALGLMQLMPTTASAFSVFDPFDPVANVMGAADFLNYLRSRFANNLKLQGLPILLAAYNAGPGAVEKYGGIPPYSETQKYVRRVIERYASAQTAVAPVLILEPKPYIIELRPGSAVTQPEPVLISYDQSSLLSERAALRLGGNQRHRHRAPDKADPSKPH